MKNHCQNIGKFNDNDPNRMSLEVFTCVTCSKAFSSENASLFQWVSKDKLLDSLTSVFLPEKRGISFQETLPCHLCCPHCFSTLYDVRRLQNEIKRLEESVQVLTDQLRRSLKRTHDKHGSEENGSTIEKLRQFLIQGMGTKETANPPHGTSNGFFTKSSNSHDYEEHDVENSASVVAVSSSSDEDFGEHHVEESSRLRIRENNVGVQQGNSFKRRRRRIVAHRSTLLWFRCTYCYKDYVKSNFKTVNGDHEFLCDIPNCNRKFYNFAVFRLHHQNSCPKKPSAAQYRCDICNKECCSSKTLARHKISFHTKQYEYYCDKCGLGLVSQGALNRHMLCHTNEKKFVCSICDKSFKRKGQLKHHRMRHSNELPCMCDNCGKRFMDTQKLKRHAACHSSEKKYPCPMCDKVFATKNYVYNHIYCTHKKRRPPRQRSRAVDSNVIDVV